MWQTQSVEPVRTAHISVLLTVNIVSHNPTQSCSDNIPSFSLNLETITITRMLSSGGEGAKGSWSRNDWITSLIMLWVFGSWMSESNDSLRWNLQQRQKSSTWLQKDNNTWNGLNRHSQLGQVWHCLPHVHAIVCFMCTFMCCCNWCVSEISRYCSSCVFRLSLCMSLCLSSCLVYLSLYVSALSSSWQSLVVVVLVSVAD